MPYINSGGEVTQKRSKWRLSIIPEFVWGLLNQITVFFQSLLGNQVSRPSTVGGGQRPQRRPIGGFNANGTVNNGGGSSGSSGGGSRPGSGGSSNRRGDMKNILACNAASG